MAAAEYQTVQSEGGIFVALNSPAQEQGGEEAAMPRIFVNPEILQRQRRGAAFAGQDGPDDDEGNSVAGAAAKPIQPPGQEVH